MPLQQDVADFLRGYGPNLPWDAQLIYSDTSGEYPHLLIGFTASKYSQPEAGLAIEPYQTGYAGVLPVVGGRGVPGVRDLPI